MKKLLSFALCLALLCGIALPAFAADSISVNYCMVEIIVDGAEIVPKDANGKPVEPFIYNGSTYLPVRSVANALGLNVDWESGMVKLTSGAERTAAIGTPLMSERDVRIPMGGQDTKVSLDGEVLELKDAAGNPVTPIISNGTTYLPVRAIADSLKVPVYWDGENRIVYLGKRIEWLVSKEVHTYDGDNTTTTYTYDANGNLLTETSVYADYTAKTTYTYDASGNMLTYAYKDNHKDYPETYTVTYTYDANGNKLSERHVDELYPEYSYTSVYTYDSKGNVLTEKTDYADNDYYHVTHTYDANGNLISSTYESRYGDYSSKYTYTNTYDAEGNLRSSIYEWTAGEDASRTETLYSYNGNVTTVRTVYDSDEVAEIQTYTYDDNDNLLESVYVYGTDRTQTVYTYDEGNKMLSEETTSSDGTVSRTTYRYDAWGNLTEMTGPYGTTKYTYTAWEW